MNTQTASAGDNSEVKQIQIENQYTINLQPLEDSFIDKIIEKEMSRGEFVDIVNQSVNSNLASIYNNKQVKSAQILSTSSIDKSYSLGSYIIGVLSGSIGSSLLTMLYSNDAEGMNNHFELMGNVISLKVLGKQREALRLLEEEILHSPNDLDLYLLRSEINKDLGFINEADADLFKVQQKTDDSSIEIDMISKRNIIHSTPSTSSKLTDQETEDDVGIDTEDVL